LLENGWPSFDQCTMPKDANTCRPGVENTHSSASHPLQELSERSRQKDAEDFWIFYAAVAAAKYLLDRQEALTARRGARPLIYRAVGVHAA
jgi:hypothetical protein